MLTFDLMWAALRLDGYCLEEILFFSRPEPLGKRGVGKKSGLR